MKKLVALLMALAMLLSLASAFAEEEVITLKVSSIWSAETEANRKPMLQTIAEFEAAYPNIKLEVEWFEANAWKETGETWALSDSLPDVFYWNAGGVLWNLVGSGDILALNDYLTPEIMDRMEPGLLADMTFNEGKIYQLPYTKAASMLYCNTELFDKYSVKIPETWDELIEAVKTFRAHGVTPMALGGADQWPTNMYTDIIALRYAGDEACRAAYYKREGATFMTQDWVDGMAAFKQLIDLGAFPEDAASLTRDESEVPYFAGEIPMYVHGQWFSGSLSAEMQQKVVAVKFPAVGKGYDNQYMGGAAEGFSVAAYTEHPDEAFLAAQFFAENLSKNGYIAGAGLPAWKYDFSGIEGLNPVMAMIKDATSTADSMLLWGNTALTGEDATLIGVTVYDVLTGEITPEQWCEDMETIFE